jgi:hypothetical protein
MSGTLFISLPSPKKVSFILMNLISWETLNGGCTHIYTPSSGYYHTIAKNLDVGPEGHLLPFHIPIDYYRVPPSFCDEIAYFKDFDYSVINEIEITVDPRVIKKCISWDPYFSN